MISVNKLPVGKNPPDDINVVIEIPKGGNIKYEIDAESGAIFVDRKLSTTMFYPGNYGFIPQTQEEDGDPTDVLGTWRRSFTTNVNYPHPSYWSIIN